MNRPWILCQALCWSAGICCLVGCSETPPAAPPVSAIQSHAPTGQQSVDTVGDLTQTSSTESEVAQPEVQDRVISGDWPMWGGDPSRNMVNTTTGVSIDFEPPFEIHRVEEKLKDGTVIPAVDQDGAGRKLLWSVPLGSQTFGPPAVAGGKVFTGTNNGGEYRPQHKGDRGCLLCFEETTGKFLWQLTREKLPSGRVNDWPEQGLVSIPCVEQDRLWVVTNRAELMCIDTDGFYDGENDGMQDEVDSEQQDADIVWSLDMMSDDWGVFPHNLAISAPVILDDLVFIVTGNGVDEAHLEIPTPRAPAFLAVNKHTGEVVWEDSSPSLDSKAPQPFDTILHGQWSSPAIGVIDGKAQVFMPGGDGVLYSFDAVGGELIWWFDLNPKESVWELGGWGTRNSIIATPVFFENSVVLAVGQDPEHGEGVGHIYRIDATKTGDMSPEISDGNGGYAANPNTGQIWHWGGIDEDGSITGEKEGLLFRRTLSTAAIHDGLVYIPDLSGFLHCLDFETGERYWLYDTFAAIWGSAMVVDGKVFVGDEDDKLVILRAGKVMEVLAEKQFPTAIYSTPVIANGTLFINDRSRMYAFDSQ